MNLKFVVPNMEGTFGTLEFAGNETELKQGYGRTEHVESRTYHLFSSVQKADDVVVKIPEKAGRKAFAYEEEVELVNARIIVEGKSIINNETGTSNGYSDYVLLADDIIKKEKQ